MSLIMKKIVSVLAVLSLILVACGPKVDPVKSDSVVLSMTEMSFANATTSTQFVTVTATGNWTAAATEAWIHLSPASGSGNGSVGVSVDPNEGSSARSGKVTVSAGSASAALTVTQEGSASVAVVPAPAAFDGTKRASTTYQLLVYSFADSDGDGVGDFKGIQNRLDYLDQMGVTALWLSPAHPTSSYHAYDVNDYYSLNPLYAVGSHTSEKAEADFEELIASAHAKGIKIYMDYVLNHTGKNNPWFKEALANPSSPYRDYYFITANPSADYKTFPMLAGTTYNADEWKVAASGSPKLTVTKTEEAVKSGNSTWNLWLWPNGGNGQAVKFVDEGNGKLYLIVEINGSYGMLVRKYNNWDAGSKYGAKSATTLTEGQTLDLVADGSDISFNGLGRYRIELSDYSVESLYYMGCFSDWMPDLNYGALADVRNNAAFQDLAASADKWINMGVDGLRLDAVKHICGGISSYNNAANRQFLNAWYERCNQTYKAYGHEDNIFMVGEVWGSHSSEEKYYYEGLTSCFEFDYGSLLSGVLNSGNAGNYVSSVTSYVADHKAQRADAITSFFLANHDQDRWAEWVGRSAAKEKQAAAMLLSGPEKPFIYQGEELGYYGTKSGGDEYVRAPMVWDSSATQVAKKGVENKVDNTMLKGSISVETQLADAGSLLNVYMTWSRLRNTYPALAEGTMTAAPINSGSIAAWYMTSGSQKLLVIHNVASAQKAVNVSDTMSKPIALLGTASLKGTTLTLGANSSVVFEL